MKLLKITRRKGIEPIVAAILLVVAAIVGGILLYLWTSGMIQSATGTATATKPIVVMWAGYMEAKTASYLNVTLKLPYALSPSDLNATLQEVECYYAINGSLANVATSPVIRYISPKTTARVFALGIELSKSTGFLKRGTSYYCRIDFGKIGAAVTPVFTVSS